MFLALGSWLGGVIGTSASIQKPFWRRAWWRRTARARRILWFYPLWRLLDRLVDPLALCATTKKPVPTSVWVPVCRLAQTQLSRHNVRLFVAALAEKTNVSRHNCLTFLIGLVYRILGVLSNFAAGRQKRSFDTWPDYGYNRDGVLVVKCSQASGDLCARGCGVAGAGVFCF